MRVVHERCCGLDVHKRMVVACVLTPDGQQTRTFGTMTRDLVALSAWLQSLDVRQVAMESTGVFWQQPIYNGLVGPNQRLLLASHLRDLEFLTKRLIISAPRLISSCARLRISLTG
jgi:transposase